MPLIDRLTAHLERSGDYRTIAGLLAEDKDATVAAPGLVRPLLVAALANRHDGPVLVAMPGEEQAARFARHLAAYLPRKRLVHIRERSDLPWGHAAPDLETVGARARAMHALSRSRPIVAVVSGRALLRAVPPHGSHVFDPLVLDSGRELDLEQAVARLARMGYERVEVAEDRGQFAVRGGVIDVYPSDGAHPVRAELFGDEIETLRRYVPSTGQDIGEAGRTEVFPCRELELSSRGVSQAERLLRDEASKDPFVAHHLERMRQGIYFNGIERYLGHLYKRPASVAEYASPKTLVVVIEPRPLFDDATRRYEELSGLAEVAGVDMEGLVLKPAQLDFGERRRLTVLSLMRAGGTVDAEIVARRPEVSGGEDKFVGGLHALTKLDYGVVLAVPDRRTRLKVGDSLVEAGLAVDELRPERPGQEVLEPRPFEKQTVHLTHAEVPSGFVVPSAQLAVVSVDDIYPRSARKMRRSVDPTQLTFTFKPGDYVVHATHGIALFREVVRQEVLGAERDYLLLEYSKGDKLYVPAEQIDRVTKYVGPEGAVPRVTRLNTSDWSRATGKARTAARKLAFDLVDLYARRSSVEGYAFSPDTPWQLEMEAAFPYVETPDQLAAIADVKSDMETPAPMDRLVCGDVGYGKTEVAIRAAFKATQDDKQVMILCPTTILAQQHFTTFSERFAPFPVRVEVLSRFRTPAQQKAALAGFAAGEVDVIIGTHRLLSRDVAPKDLGLVIIDEEQRFGVEHKEHIKNLREQVDVLAMSATPIPRTLQMSLSGVRDMSVIDTPPPNRFPVQVHVGEWDEDVVSGAIRRELERGGQVYYVSNRVMSIDDAVSRVRDAAPEARVEFAHGKMSEKQLESVMERFAANEIDVLVATTIIESGIDNPHSNTLIIEDSQRLGLAQLYQLKGRVGRSHVKAYAYFLFPRASALTEQATERLVAIREHDDLGSGIQIAMRDLEIRGAGSLLGAEQSGNVSAVGFDLFAQMLTEAVTEARGEPVSAHPDIRVDLPLSAYLPEEYVDAVDERVRYYRRLAGSVTIEAVDAIAGDLGDRYGQMPEPARNLVAVARIRAMAAEAGITSVSLVRRRVMLGPLKAIGDEALSKLTAAGAVVLRREDSVARALEYGESVTSAVMQMLDAILGRSSP